MSRKGYQVLASNVPIIETSIAVPVYSHCARLVLLTFPGQGQDKGWGTRGFIGQSEELEVSLVRVRSPRFHWSE